MTAPRDLLRRLVFRARYARGAVPWDRPEPPRGLVELLEGERALARGAALDLGCGLGTVVVYLARRGWDATGVDLDPRAIAGARARARAAGVSARFLVGDVCRLPETTVGGPFDLVVDSGCFHGLGPAARPGYLASLAWALRPGGTYLLYAFEPARWAWWRPAELKPTLLQWLFPGVSVAEVDTFAAAGLRVEETRYEVAAFGARAAWRRMRRTGDLLARPAPGRPASAGSP